MLRRSETNNQRTGRTNGSTAVGKGVKRQAKIGATQSLQSSARLQPKTTVKRGRPPKKVLVPKYQREDRIRGGTQYRGGPNSVSFKIRRNHLNMWKIVKKGGGRLPNGLTGDYTTFGACERKLIAYLRQYPRAVYPGSDGTS